MDLWKKWVSNQSWLRLGEHAIAGAAVALAVHYVRKNGVKKVMSNVVGSALNVIPGAASVVNKQIQDEVDKSVAEMFPETEESKSVPTLLEIPQQGIPRAEVLRRLRMLSSLNVKASDGKGFAYVYAWGDEHTGDEKHIEDTKKELSHYDVVTEAHTMHCHDNALNPVAFKSLRRLEVEVVSMAGKLFNGPDGVCGTMTSGGTESIMMAVKSYRDRAKKLYGITEPNIILPITGHPAFEKAGHYFGVEVIHIPTTSDHRADIGAMKRAINSNTIALVVSAPQYPHGVIDPIEEAGVVAEQHNLPLHVDGCVGGYLLPFIERMGVELPLWDFRVPAVTSISADLHKYGYAPKGASTIIWRSPELRKYQLFAYANWPGGLFVSPSALGSRSGGAIAGAWASLASLGIDGFVAKTRECMQTRDYMLKNIKEIAGLDIVGKPHATIVTFQSSDEKVNIFAVADRLEKEYGWNMERQTHPDSLHLSLMPVHSLTREQFVNNLRASVEYIRKHSHLADSGTAAMYGMVAKIPSDSIVEDFLKSFMGKVYSS
jgi:sphinganine-1-phosphate aldolase